MSDLRKSVERPTQYTPELGDEICTRLVEGETLKRICEDDHMPKLSLVYQWNRGSCGSSAEYVRAYAQSRLDQAHTLVDEISDIVDTSAVQVECEAEEAEAAIIKAGGSAREARVAFHKQRRESESIRRMRVDARKWIAGRINRHRYGDKVAVVDETPPKQIRKTVDLARCSTEQLEAIMKISEGLPGVDTNS